MGKASITIAHYMKQLVEAIQHKQHPASFDLPNENIDSLLPEILGKESFLNAVAEIAEESRRVAAR